MCPMLFADRSRWRRMQERALSAEAMVAAPASPKSLCRRSRRVNEAERERERERGLGASTKLSPTSHPYAHTSVKLPVCHAYDTCMCPRGRKRRRD